MNIRPPPKASETETIARSSLSMTLGISYLGPRKSRIVNEGLTREMLTKKSLPQRILTISPGDS